MHHTEAMLSTRPRPSGAHPEFRVAATHGRLLGEATGRRIEAGVRDLLISDSVPIAERGDPLWPVSVAPLLACAIRQFAADGSVEALG